MLRNKNLLTENSKTDNIENNKYRPGNLFNMRQNLLYPLTQSNGSQKYKRNNENSFNNKKSHEFINSTNNEKFISIPSNGLINSKEISNSDYNYNKNKKSYRNIYINNYILKRKKFKVARNYEDITKYFSKSYKRTKITTDTILTDFDTNNSKQNNIFYLVNNNNEKLRNNNNNISNIYNIGNKSSFQNISKISLPFCIYNYNYQIPIRYDEIMNINEEKKVNEEKKENEINLPFDNKLNNSFEENKLRNISPQIPKQNYIKENITKKDSLIEEENNEENEPEEIEKIEEEENEEELKEVEKHSEISETFDNIDIESELSKRGDISIHNIINRIRLPQHHIKDSNILKDKKNRFDLYRKNKQKNKNKNESNSRNININADKRKSKSLPKEIKINNDEDNDKKRIKSVPKIINSKKKSSNRFIKSKRIELLRE